MLGLVYNALLYVAAPIAFGAQLWRGVKDPAYRERRGERFGLGVRLPTRQNIWIHAVSVGEVQAAAPLIRELVKRYPQHRIVVTTGTPTGAARVKALFADSVQHIFLPYDVPGAVKRFLDRITPCIAVVMETEVWPNLFRECARRDIPLVIASARLSQKSVRGYRWLASLFKEALASDIEIAAQTQGDADRFISVGANPQRTRVIGSVKFDLEISDEIRQRGRAWRDQHCRTRPVWVAGSTHAIEEDIVLDAHARLRAMHPNALLLLVPRHPPRFNEVRDALAAKQVQFVTRSSNASLTDRTEVVLVDTLGELLMFYAAADVAFVGGSLVPIGGHNLLEPAALGLPVITGPHNFNAADSARALTERGAAILVHDANELAAELNVLLTNSGRRDAMIAQAHDVIASNRGALQRLLDLLATQLDRKLD